MNFLNFLLIFYFIIQLGQDLQVSASELPFFVSNPNLKDSAILGFTPKMTSPATDSYHFNVIEDRHISVASNYQVSSNVINLNLHPKIHSFKSSSEFEEIQVTLTSTAESFLDLLDSHSNTQLLIVYVDQGHQSRYSVFKSYLILPDSPSSFSHQKTIKLMVTPTTFFACFETIDLSMQTNYLPAEHFPQSSDPSDPNPNPNPNPEYSAVYSPGIKWNAKRDKSSGSGSGSAKASNISYQKVAVIPLFNHVNDQVESSDHIHINCSNCYFVFDGKLNLTISASLWDGLKYLGGVFEPSIYSNLEFGLDIDFHSEIHHSTTIYSRKLAPFTFGIGIIPFSINPELDVDFDIDLQLDAVFNNTVGTSLVATSGQYGYAYKQDHGWGPIHIPSQFNYSYTPLVMAVDSVTVKDIVFKPSIVPKIVIGLSSGVFISYGSLSLEIPLVLDFTIDLQSPKCTNVSEPLDLTVVFDISADWVADIDIAVDMFFWTQHIFKSSSKHSLGYILEPTQLFEFCAPSIWSAKAPQPPPNPGDSGVPPLCDSCVETQISTNGTFNVEISSQDPSDPDFCTKYFEFNAPETMLFTFLAEPMSNIDNMLTLIAPPEQCCDALNSSLSSFNLWSYLEANTTDYESVDLFLIKGSSFLFEVLVHSIDSTCNNNVKLSFVKDTQECFVFFDSVYGSDITGTGDIDAPFKTLDSLGTTKCVSGSGILDVSVYLYPGTYSLDDYVPFASVYFQGLSESVEDIVLECKTPNSSLVNLDVAFSDNTLSFTDLTIQNCHRPIVFNQADWTDIYFDSVLIQQNYHSLVHAPLNFVNTLTISYSRIMNNTIAQQSFGFIAAQSGIDSLTIEYASIESNTFSSPFIFADNTNYTDSNFFEIQNTNFKHNTLDCSIGTSVSLGTFLGTSLFLNSSLFAQNVVSSPSPTCDSSLLVFDGLYGTYHFYQSHTNLISNGFGVDTESIGSFGSIYNINNANMSIIEDSIISQNLAFSSILSFSNCTLVGLEEAKINNNLFQGDGSGSGSDSATSVYCNSSIMNFDFASNILRGSMWSLKDKEHSSQPKNLVCDQCQGCTPCVACGSCGQCSEDGCALAPDSDLLCGPNHSCSPSNGFTCIVKKPVAAELTPDYTTVITIIGAIVVVGAGIFFARRRIQKRKREAAEDDSQNFLSLEHGISSIPHEGAILQL